MPPIAGAIAKAAAFQATSGPSTFQAVTATSVLASSTIAAGAANKIEWTGRSVLESPSDGVVRFSNAAVSVRAAIEVAGITATGQLAVNVTSGKVIVGNVVSNTGVAADYTLAISNTTAPSGSPVSGGFLFAEAGAGKWRGSSGTVTTFGPAEPHCPSCGRDFMTEHENDDTGYLAMCLSCLADEIGARPWILRARRATECQTP